MITLYLTVGVLAGFGFGLIYLPAIVCLTQHFHKHLALATGLAVSASGIGCALFAPFTEQLIQHNGWRPAMQIISLLLLLSGLCALSFREPRDADDRSSCEDSGDDDSRKKIVQFEKPRRCSIDSLHARKQPPLSCSLALFVRLLRRTLPDRLG